MVVAGILHVYVFGTFCDWRWLCLAGAIPSTLYLLLMFLPSESPSYLVSRGKNDEAKKSLQRFRGWYCFYIFLTLTIHVFQ